MTDEIARAIDEYAQEVKAQTQKKTYPEAKNLCPLNGFKTCIKRDCSLYNVFEKEYGLLGIVGLSTNMWKLLNIIKEQGR